MKVNNITNMVKGWFIGDFEPSVLKTDDFEISLRRYKEGDKESRHVHLVATEYTVVVTGMIKMNGHVYADDAIIEISPGESADFEAITDCITIAVKVPSVKGDKYEIGKTDSPQG